MITQIAIDTALSRFTWLYSHGSVTNKQILIVDFTLPSTEERMILLDTDTNDILYSCCVAHGSGSGDLIPTHFSNIPNSHESSIGGAITGESYIGKHGKSIRLYGLDITNSDLYDRDIVIHTAPYIGNGQSGHSWGCFAIPLDDSDLINMIPPKTLLYAYSNIGQ